MATTLKVASMVRNYRSITASNCEKNFKTFVS